MLCYSIPEPILETMNCRKSLAIEIADIISSVVRLIVV